MACLHAFGEWCSECITEFVDQHHRELKAHRKKARWMQRSEAAEARETRLREALQTYGQHKDGCDAWPQFTGHFTQASHVGKCTCGLDALLVSGGGET